MRGFVIALGSVLDLLTKIAVVIGCVGLVAMTVIVTWQVIGRFILNNSPSWTEPISLLLMLYFILLVAAVGVRERFHLGLDLIRIIAPPSVCRIMDMVSFVVVGCFGASMAWYGWDLMAESWGYPIPAIMLPEGLHFLPIVASGALIFLFSIECLMRLMLNMPIVTTEGHE